MPPAVPFLQAGRLKAIAVTSRQRSPIFPQAPALAEIQGLESFDLTNWFGVLARTGTPQPVLDKLASACAAILKDAQVQEVLKRQPAVPVGDTPTQFRDFIHEESAKDAKIVGLTGVRLD